MNMGTTGLDATNEAYRKRAGLDKDVTVVLDELDATPPAPEVEDDEELSEGVSNGSVSEDLRADEPEPDMSWKKDAIIDRLVESGVDAPRDELEKMTKLQLIERFTDYQV